MNVQVSPKHKVVGVPDAEVLRNLFPNSPVIGFGGSEHRLIPHDPTNTFLLRHQGYHVPAPILTQYDFPHPVNEPPFDVQKQTCALFTMNPRSYCLNGMGTGKTRCPLWAWDYLRGNGLCGRILVTAPLSTLGFTWAREVFNTLSVRRVGILYGSRADRIKVLNNLDNEILIINHDGVKTILKELLADNTIDVLCIDELAAFRNNSDRTSAMRKLARRMKWVWGMTGSPIPHAPTDAWNEASIVTPNTIPTRFTRFREEVMYQPSGSSFKWIPRPDAVEKAFNVLQPAVRYNLDDVVELPDIITRFVDIELETETAKIYKELMNKCRVAVQNHEITAANAGAVMMKLLQVSCGWVYDKHGHTIELESSARIKALIDGIEGSDRKVIVFSPFKHVLSGISSALTANDIEHATVSGDTLPNERGNIFSLFQNSSNYRVINAHPSCMSHGLTLTAADTIIWFAPPMSYDTYDQANHRIRRVGQKFKQLILHLQASPVEKKMYKILRANQITQDSLLAMFEADTEANPQM